MATITYPNLMEIDFGAIKVLGDALKRNGITRPLICTDKGIVDSGIFDTVRGVLPNDVEPTVFDGTPANPTEVAVRQALVLYRANDCDGIISIGGGSSMDLGKGVALTVTHDGPMNDYSAVNGGRDRIGGCPPIIAIPTTAGTGSEVGGGAVIITEDGHKVVIGSPNLLPKMAICDPELTLGLPKYLTAATGMDAMAHCIEAYCTPVVNPPAAAIGLDGLERVVTYLKRAVDDGQDREARWHMMMAASEGAMAFAKGLGCVHSMSHALGADEEMRLHHGTLNAVILPTVLRFNADHVGDKYVRLRRAMGLEEGADIAAWIENFNVELGLPGGLREMGVREDMFPALAEHCMTDACHFANPRTPTVAQYEVMFAEAMGA
ncbi:MAG: iron-containing alcohol dehydrogenase [Rhodospirillaceae bacterium]|jgi:4-hydroxybutyrate dehydrogenase|nr:iron-containing alcohol dehydrogenase [Rhodospirillaceae bacterium]MBT4489994.1 iron-containing alcohol dehydrogenase [Rhodospirillaceae bacterium]MBT5191362.1 iron-containing alcohol dehydrogenase [Rhodospirillaceae bacterium]MBT5898181.1 iron-containing alcohol dehydrogenase [Rhodospirillaceae bacterium]MBT6430954.1 iron-containing alcohol dehydrogenase [Rhodospirillaceae bacterium]